MDAHTLELLEFAKVRALLAGYATSALGKERCGLVEPLRELEALRTAIAQTTEMVELIGMRMAPPLGGLRDVRTDVRKAGLAVLVEIEPLLAIRDVLELTGRIRDYWHRLGPDFPATSNLLANVEDFRWLGREIDQCIDERGKVRDSASPELRRVRAELAEFDAKIDVEFRRLMRSPEIRKALRYPQPTLSGDHHVLAVAVNYRHVVSGVVHRVSSTGETIYIEPSRVAQISADAALVRRAEEREIRRVLRKLTDRVGQSSAAILAAVETLTVLDLTYAKASYSLDFAMTAPEVGEGPIRMLEARHPLLEKIFRDRAAASQPDRNVCPTSPPPSVVPVTVELGNAFDLLVVTGPNTGGKTVALKTVGLLSIMALAGMHIPARRESRVPLLDDVLADIGDEQSLQQSLSTFSSHISRIASILERGSPKTLVLLDELGAGTDPTEGAALGRAILDELRRLGCPAIVTTHLGDLKLYALSADRVENAAVEFDAATLRPTHRLIVGQFGQSCALKIARRLKLPNALVRRASHYLRRRSGRRLRELEQVQELRREAIEAREEARAAQLQAEQAADDLRRKAEAMQQEAIISAEIEKARATLRPGDPVRVTRFDKQGRIVRVDSRRQLATVAVGAVEWELPLAEIVPIAHAARSSR